MGGMSYQTPGHNSNAIIQDGEDIPVRIMAIFINRNTSRVSLAIERYIPLSESDQFHNWYREFGFPVAGSLFYDLCAPPEIIPAHRLVSLFGKTSYYHEEIGKAVIHALPLSKVCCHSLEHWTGLTQSLQVLHMTGKPADSEEEEMMDVESAL
jgi:hypothetical protein